MKRENYNNDRKIIRLRLMREIYERLCLLIMLSGKGKTNFVATSYLSEKIDQINNKSHLEDLLSEIKIEDKLSNKGAFLIIRNLIKAMVGR